MSKFIKYNASIGKLAQDDITISDVMGLSSSITALNNHLADTNNPHSVTASQVGLGNVTNDAQLKRGPNDFASFPSKATVTGNDLLLIEDSDDGGNKKKILASQLASSSSSSSNFIPKDNVTVTNDNFTLPAPVTQNVHLFPPSYIDENFLLLSGTTIGVNLPPSTSINYQFEFVCPWDLVITSFAPFGFSVNAPSDFLFDCSISVHNGSAWTDILPPGSFTITSPAVTLTNPQFVKAGTPVRLWATGTSNTNQSTIAYSNAIATSYLGSNTGDSSHPYWDFVLGCQLNDVTIVDINLPASYQNDVILLTNAANQHVDYRINWHSTEPASFLPSNTTTLVSRGKPESFKRHFRSVYNFNIDPTGINLLEELYNAHGERFNGLVTMQSGVTRFALRNTVMRFEIFFDDYTFPNTYAAVRFGDQSGTRYEKYNPDDNLFDATSMGGKKIDGLFFIGDNHMGSTALSEAGLYLTLLPTPTGPTNFTLHIELVSLGD